MIVFSLFTPKIKVFLFSLLFLFLPTQLGKHFWPSFAFVYGQRIDYLSPTLYITDLLAILCIFTSIKSSKNIPYVKISLLMLFLSIGVFFSKNPLAGWYGIAKLLEFIFLGFSLKNFFKESPTHISLLAILLSFGVFFESVLAVVQFLVQHSVGGILYLFGERTFSGTTPGIANVSLYHQLILRPYATFSHPNVLAGYLLISMLLMLSVFARVSKEMKTFLLFSIMVGSLALFLSLSRLAIFLWILICIAIFLHYLYQKRKAKRVLVLGAIFLIIAIFICFLSPLSERFLQTNLLNESVTSRIELMQVSLSLWQSHILFGVGFDNFLTNVPLGFSPNGHTVLLQPVHNIFLLVLSETGLGGLVFFFVFLWHAIKHLIHRLQTQSMQKTHIIFLIITFVSSLLLGMEDHYLFTLQQGQLLFTVVLSLILV